MVDDLLVGDQRIEDVNGSSLQENLLQSFEFVSVLLAREGFTGVMSAQNFGNNIMERKRHIS